MRIISREKREGMKIDVARDRQAILCLCAWGWVCVLLTFVLAFVVLEEIFFFSRIRGRASFCFQGPTAFLELVQNVLLRYEADYNFR